MLMLHLHTFGLSAWLDGTPHECMEWYVESLQDCVTETIDVVTVLRWHFPYLPLLWTDPPLAFLLVSQEESHDGMFLYSEKSDKWSHL